MKQFITAFIHNWSPLHLRKRVAKLEHDLDHLTEMRDDFISEANRHNVEEIERLTKVIRRLAEEKVELKAKYVNMANEITKLFRAYQDLLWTLCILYPACLK